MGNTRMRSLMPGTLRGGRFAGTYFLFFFLLFSFLFLYPLAGHAQTAVTSVNHPSIDESPCGATANNVGCTRTNADSSVTACGGSLGTPQTCRVTFPDNSYTTITPGSGLGGSVVQNFNSQGTLIGTNNNGTQTGQQNDASATTNQGEPISDGCGITSIKNIGTCIVDGIKAGMGWIIGAIAFGVLGVASFMLWMVGGLFNWVVIKTVFQFGTYFGASAGMLTAWGIMRDLGNIVLLFGFIFMGLATILNTHATDAYSARKALPSLIIFAILLNFSLFTSQLVIDTANSFAAVFTAQAGYKCDEATGQDAENTCANVGIAGNVLKLAGIASIWNMTSFENYVKHPSTAGPIFLGLALFVTITAVVLLAASIMLVSRAVILCFLMITSPIGFAGMAIPPLQKIAKKWWDELLCQSFFAPIYLLLVLISLKIVEGLTGGGRGESFATALMSGNSTSGPEIIVLFAIVIGFMIGSMLVAKKMSCMGSGFAIGAASGIVGGATLGTVGFVGRRTVGRASAAAATRIRNSSLGETNFGRKLAGVADYGSKASYSARNVATKLGGKYIDFGKANKTAEHGYHGIEEKAEKERVDYAKSLKGPRDRTDAEHRARMARDQTALDARRAAATAALPAAGAAEAAATAAQTAAQTNLMNQEQMVAALRARVASNPQDAAAQAQLLQEERRLTQDTASLSRADQQLASATNALAAARREEAEANAAQVDPDRGRIEEPERLNNYADSLRGERTLRYANPPLGTSGPGVTLAGHANHNAERAIRSYAGQTPEQRQQAALQAALNRLNVPPPAAHGPAPAAHPPAVPGGGAPHP